MSDSDYHRRRALQEMRAADAATDKAVRGLHLDLAARHAALAEHVPAMPVSMLPA